MTTLIPKFDLKDGGATPTGAVNRAINKKLSEFVSVLDFGADPTGVADSTTAFTNAQTASKNVYIPEGTYLLNGLRIQNGVSLIGAGKTAVRINQASAGSPAINCLSDATVGQLKNVELSGFTVYGATGATVTAILIEANGVFAIWNSTFDYSAQATFRALEINGPDASNVFQCKFTVQSENTSSVAVYINGCAYSTFDLFLTQCQSYAMSDGSGGCVFTRLITDGAWTSNSQNNVYINPVIEDIYATSVSNVTGISLNGFNQILISPVINLNASSSVKIDYCIQTFTFTQIINPRFLVNGTPDPFITPGNYDWTLIGPGQNGCVNKMESYYNNSNASQNLRMVNFVGNCSEFTLNPIPHGGKSIQYLAPSGSFNLTIQNNTDAMIINGSGTIAVANVGYGYAGQTSYINGQTLSIWTANAITAFNFSGAGGVDTSLFPSTLTAGQKVTFIYHSVTNKWYPI
jgi:hypothetical protein